MKILLAILLLIGSLYVAEGQSFKIEKIDSKQEHCQDDGFVIFGQEDPRNRDVSSPDTVAIAEFTIINRSNDVIYLSYITIICPEHPLFENYPLEKLSFIQHRHSVEMNNDTITLSLNDFIIPPGYKGTIGIYAFIPDIGRYGGIYPMIESMDDVGMFWTKDSSKVDFEPGFDRMTLAQIYVHPTTSVVENQSQDEKTISVYPNPVIDIMHIQSDTPIASYQIYDMNGRLVINGSDDNQVNMSNMLPGAYMAMINGQIIKLIKQ